MLYRGAVSFTRSFDPASVIDTLFESNGWGRSWRDTVYDFVHYHSQIHEVMGIARGAAKIECGDIKGRILKLKAGDVAVLPAGTGHRLIEASRNFLVVGAYPEDGLYDECTDMRDRADAKDPVFRARGPLTRLWSGPRKRSKNFRRGKADGGPRSALMRVSLPPVARLGLVRSTRSNAHKTPSGSID